jgi:uncharacterized protein YyaL (SSP411 family)
MGSLAMLKIGTRVSLLALVVFTASCRKENDGEQAVAAPAVIDAALSANAMTVAPQGLLTSRAASPVHWQYWEPSVLKRAADARRLVFVFVGSAQYPGCVEALDAIDRDPALVARLNREFVPVLADGDLSRECLLAAGQLSEEIKLPPSLPFILVLSPEGNEVTWRPVAFAPGADLRELFEGASDVVSRMWAESPDYVNRNSVMDHEGRIGRLPKPDPIPANPAERDDFLQRATRQLVSLYDEDIASLSGTGGLLPLGILQCLASASLDPASTPDTAARCREAVETFGTTILSSAMVDPLDGGVYSSRRGNSWMLPMPNRTCITQARAARSLVTLHAATGNTRSLEVALGAVRFAEEQFKTPDGLFATQRLPAATPSTESLWTSEQIDRALTPPEAALWRKISAIADLGNLTDAGGSYFRLNSLGFRIPLAVAAESLKLPVAEASALLESGRRKLLKARIERMPLQPASPAGSAAPSFRMISAYAALFTVTGDPVWRDKAITLAKQSRQAFSASVLLVEQSPAVPAVVCDARAFTYALAIQAALDLAEITLDEIWLIRAGDLATTVAEQFVDADGRLLEARPASTPLRLPVTDRVMLFDDSTAGLMRMNLARLDALGQPPPPAIAPLLRSLPDFASYPVVFTDSILATSFARSRVIIELPATASAEWREAASRLPLDRIARRIGKGATVIARQPDGSEIPVATPADLPRLTRTSAP